MKKKQTSEAANQKHGIKQGGRGKCSEKLKQGGARMVSSCQLYGRRVKKRRGEETEHGDWQCCSLCMHVRVDAECGRQRAVQRT